MSWRPVVVSGVIVLLAGALAFQASIRSSQARSLLKSDGLGYFLYTRSLVVDGNVNLANEMDGLGAHFSPVATEAIDRFARRLPGNHVELPWPVGIALLMAPFYAVGLAAESVAAVTSGRPVDTYGLIPQVAYGAGALAWGLLGFWVTVACCRLALRDRSSKRGELEATRVESVARRATLAVVLGGPLVFYVFVQPAMAHAPSFGLVALLTYHWLLMWERGATVRGFALLAFLMGLATIVRYQNIVFGLLPASLLLRELGSGRWRFSLRASLAGVTAAAIPLVVQVLHLRALRAGGTALNAVGAYEAAQNPLDLSSPHFLDVLFSCEHGAFYWTPVLALGFAGLAIGARRSRWALVLIATFLADAWLVGSLQGPGNWSGGSSFGMRYLSECSPFLATGLAILLARSARGGALGAWAVALGALVAWNLALLVAFSLRAIDPMACVTLPEMAKGMLDVLRRRN